MTNREKLKEVFPYTIFIYRKEDDKTDAIMCTDEWLDSEYIEPTTKNNLSSGLEKNSKKLEKDFGELDCISRKRAIERLKLNFPISQGADNSRDRHRYMQALADLQAIKELPSITPQEPTIKALGEELRKARKGIAEEKVLIGYNMAIAICNKHLEGSEAADDQSGAG